MKTFIYSSIKALLNITSNPKMSEVYTITLNASIEGIADLHHRHVMEERQEDRDSALTQLRAHYNILK